jgi:hypothetical protein
MNHLETLAKRVEDDPFFLASALKIYSLSEGLDDPGLATRLGCEMEALALLRLCRSPDASRFREDIDQIVSRYQLDRTALLQAVRLGQTVLQLRRTHAGSEGTLLAARDGDDETPPKNPEGGNS